MDGSTIQEQSDGRLYDIFLREGSEEALLVLIKRHIYDHRAYDAASYGYSSVFPVQKDFCQEKRNNNIKYHHNLFAQKLNDSLKKYEIADFNWVYRVMNGR